MRREGAVFGHRTSHTVRTYQCGEAVAQSRCKHHSREAVEVAYRDLLLARGKQRFSRKELHEEALRIFSVQGAYRNKLYACAIGKPARKINRACSCCRLEQSPGAKHKRKIELENKMYADLEEYDHFYALSEP